MKKVLIIEDDQLVANIYGNKFSVDHYQVETALDGATGLDLVGSFHPDVVLLDLMLPKISGLDLLRKIRSLPGLDKLPIIVFSNTYLSNMVQEAWKAGATKCLSKANCTPKQVIEVVRGLLSQGPAAPVAAPVAAPPPTTVPVPTSAPVAAAAPPPAQTAGPAAEPDSDEAFEAELRQSFLAALPGNIAGARSYLQELVRTQSEPERVQLTQELYRRVHTLTGNAGIASLRNIARIADALEALLKELYEKPKNINPIHPADARRCGGFPGRAQRSGQTPERRKHPGPG